MNMKYTTNVRWLTLSTSWVSWLLIIVKEKNTLQLMIILAPKFDMKKDGSNMELKMVKRMWTCSPMHVKHVFLLDPHLITHHSNVGVHFKMSNQMDYS